MNARRSVVLRRSSAISIYISVLTVYYANNLTTLGTTASVANSSINRAPIPRAISPDTHRGRPCPLGTLR